MTDATPLASEQITQALSEAFKLIDNLASEMNGAVYPHDTKDADDIAMDLADAFGVPFNEHWASGVVAAISATPVPSDQDASQAQGEVWQHVKRGTRYTVIGTATLQATGPLDDYAHLVVYRGEDGALWAREDSEFYDGRFVRVSAPGATAQDGVEEAEYLRRCELEQIADGAYGDGSFTRGAARDQLAALKAPTPTIPAGMVAVPRDPTNAMLEAVETVDFDTDDERAMACNVWNTMLAAAPKQAEQQGVERIAEVLMRFDLDHDGDWPMDKVRGALGYRDSEHSGDCAKQPWTCMRCACDEVYKIANALAAALNAPTGTVEKERGA